MKKNILLFLFIFSISLVSAATFVDPLDLRRWLVEILSGTPEIFTSISIIAIFTLAGFFRMNMITTAFMVVIYFVMFNEILDQSIYFLILIIGSLVAGYVIQRIVKR